MKWSGITIDDKLKFDKQVDILCKNAARQLNLFYRFKGIFPFKKKRKNIYYFYLIQFYLLSYSL